MPIFENGPVRISYEEAGSGFPLLIIPGGGLNATMAGLAGHAFNPMEEFASEFRCITMDLRNANGGASAESDGHDSIPQGSCRRDQPFKAQEHNKKKCQSHDATRGPNERPIAGAAATRETVVELWRACRW